MRGLIRALVVVIGAGLALPAWADPLPAPITDPRARVFSFEDGLEGWTKLPPPPRRKPGGATRPAPSVVASAPVEAPVEVDGRHVAALSLTNGTSVALRRPGAIDLSGFQTLRFDVRLPRLNAQTHLAVYFVDDTDFWYQTWRPIRPKAETWDTVEVNLRPDGAAFEPLGHSRPWGAYVARSVKEMGIWLFADRAVSGTAYIDNIAFLPYPERVRPQEVFNYETSGDRVGRYQKFEVTFELSRAYENPFDPAQIEVTGAFVSPSGKTVSVPGFYYQDYERRVDRKMECLAPVGSPKWKIRFAPVELGAYSYRIHVRDRDSLVTPARTFVCVASDDPGFVRVCARDKRYFEFDNGDFFYPIGENIPATYDERATELLGLTIERIDGQVVNEGTLAYDRFIEGMKRGRQNYARIWLACWSFGLEWTSRYERAYAGLGRYNQENAWRLDHVMDNAQDAGIYVQLALTTFSHFKAGSTKAEEANWEYSPYNTHNGGPLAHPQQFWNHAPSQDTYQRMVRYVMARWGYATHIAAWELCNEVNLVTDWKGNKEPIIEWHRRCAKTIQQFDPNGHMVTSSFSQGEGDFSLFAIPEISFTSTHYYAVQIIDAMRKTVWPAKSALGKPAIMGECGYHWMGSSPETTERYLHICLWSSYMIPFAGSGLSWWWDYIDDRNLYDRFSPLAAYAAGEDRRGRGLDTSDGVALDAAGSPVSALAVLALQNDQSAYFWVYERQLLRAESAAAFTPGPQKDISVEIRGLKAGDYKVEFWDTEKGAPIQETVVKADGVLRVPAPAFTGDIAGKVKPVSAPASSIVSP